MEQLTALGLQSIELSKTESKRPRQALAADDFIFFNEQLAAMASAGLSLDEGLRELARDVESPRLRRVLESIAGELQRGTPLEEAIAKREADLPVLYSRVVRAGIRTGQLPGTLLNLSQHLRSMRETNRMIAEALTYPLTVLSLTVAIVSAVMLYVVPMFKGVFFDFSVKLPRATLFLLSLSDAFRGILLVIGLVVAFILLVWFALRFSPTGRRVREHLFMALPIVGAITRASLTARFARSLSLTTSSGLPLPEALRLSAGATGSTTLDQDADAMAAHIEQGHSPADLTSKLTLIPPMFAYVVEVATGRGNLPESLAQLANAYDLRASRYRSVLKSWLVPASILLIGGVVGLCILAMFLPLIQMIQSISM
jgi:type II secretory pathway component PulF